MYMPCQKWHGMKQNVPRSTFGTRNSGTPEFNVRCAKTRTRTVSHTYVEIQLFTVLI